MSFRIILVHGFQKNYRDMEVLQENLENFGYKVENLNFPLMFPDIKFSVEILKNYLLELKFDGFNTKEEIVLIGHGLGGKLIEKTLKLEEVKGIVDKVVLIATPIKDSVLHRRLKRVFPILDRVFKPLKCFKRNYDFFIDEKIEVGVIVGTETFGFFSKWLGPYNDGFVKMKECIYSNAKDTLLLPLVHNEIHKKIGTAKYINNFISKGVFKTK